MAIVQDLILRCYGYKTPRNTWIAKCIDLDLATEEDTFQEARRSLEEAIEGYIETVLDTEDKESIVRLLQRKSPIRDRLIYESIRLSLTRKVSASQPIPFLQPIPFHLAHAH